MTSSQSIFQLLASRLGSIVSGWRFLNPNKDTLIFLGDDVQSQNGFGAFKNDIYELASIQLRSKFLTLEQGVQNPDASNCFPGSIAPEDDSAREGGNSDLI